jgi:hypothetical protein
MGYALLASRFTYQTDSAEYEDAMPNIIGRTTPARNAALDKALFLLSRPASLAAMAVLLLNDHLLRRLWPSWWTGKLGDFTWLYFMPFAAAALFALVLPRRITPTRRADLVGWLAFGTIGGVFSLAKTLPVFHTWLVGSLGALLGFPVGWQRDPADLMALISLAAAWVAWQRALRPLVPTAGTTSSPSGAQGQAGFESLEVGFKVPPSPQPSPSEGEGAAIPSLLRGEGRVRGEPWGVARILKRAYTRLAPGFSEVSPPRLRRAGRGDSQAALQPVSKGSLGWIALPLAALLTIANGPAPNSGIACLQADNQRLLASSSYLDFVSTDGGLSWQPSELRCQYHGQGADGSITGLISDPRNKAVQYRFKLGATIERSEDAGETWRTEFNLSPPGQANRLYMEKSHTGAPVYRAGPLDALVDPNTGNAIFAMGFEGILVRKTNGEWVWAAAGDYRHTTPLQITQPASIFAFLSGELVLAALLGLLLVCTLSMRLNRHRLRLLVLGLGWLSWVVAATVIPPSLAQGYAIPVSSLFSLAAVVLVVPFSLESLYRIGQNSLRALPGVALVAVGGALLFFLPYILWALNGLPDYYMALGFGGALALATLVVGYWRTRRLLVKKEGAA